jgi:hypothetical protein
MDDAAPDVMVPVLELTTAGGRCSKSLTVPTRDPLAAVLVHTATTLPLPCDAV